MANIKEYTSRTSPGGPIAPPGRKASNAGEYIADGLTSLGQGIAQAGQTIQQDKDKRLKIKGDDEVLSMNTKLSELQSRYKVSWADTIAKADPNDSELSNRFLKSFDEESGKLGDNLSTEAGKNYYRQNLSNIRSNFQETTAAGQAHLASVATKQNYIQSLNMSSAGLISDPTSFGSVKALHDSAIDHLILSGKLPSDKAQELRTSGNAELAQSYVRGWIKNSPQQAKAILDSGQVDALIGGDAKKSLYGELTVEQNAREVKQKQMISDQEKAVKESQRQTYDNFVGLSVNGKLNVDTVMASNLPGEKKEHFVRVIEKNITSPSFYKTDPEKFHDLYERIAMTDPDDPTAIVDEEQLEAEFRTGYLGFGDYEKLRAELNKGKTEEGKRELTQKNHAYTMMKETIYRGAGPKDPQAPELYMRAQRAYDAAFQEGIAKGKSVTELTDPDFIKKVMKPFVRTPQAKLKDTAKIIQDYKAKTQNQAPKDIRSKMAESLRKRNLGG